MEQCYQDLALIAASRLAEKNPNHAYAIQWEGKNLIIKPAHAANGQVVVTSDGVSGDATLAELIEKTMIRVASGNDAREIGYAHGMTGRPPLETNGAYGLGYEYGTKNRKS
jgi:hypothetical protein